MLGATPARFAARWIAAMTLQSRIAWFVLLLVGACGTPAATPAAKPDAAADALAAADVAADGQTTDLGAKDTAKDVPADVVVPCSARAGGYLVDGTCSNGGSSIPYACMLVKGCELTWESDFRDWTGPLTGVDYALKNADGKETITGHFTSATTAEYQYKSSALTCDSTMELVEPSAATRLCCDPALQDCGVGQACVPVSESVGGNPVATTGCVDLAKDATSLGAVCTQDPNESPCAKGLVCVSMVGGKAADFSHCQKLCVGAGDCGSGETCVILGGTPKAGLCTQACSPFSDAAAALHCPSGQACAVTSVSDAKAERVLGGLCIVPGGAAVGAKCSSGAECGAGLVCFGKECQALCDDKHACASPATCKAFEGGVNPALGASFGSCQ